ncbi:MAG: NAD-dependent epimerase/dehydratase family protein, partial [Candidatus Thorarchaeota archaeon]|nr:NAD-dependent epimerase/dehydratase family protein [Candidatus Thorarchaeota archaeon]
MRVLVTGATGFIGRKFVARLIENEFDVVAFVRETSNTA